MTRANPRDCIFCGRTKDLTKEHLWPAWVGEVLPATDWLVSELLDADGTELTERRRFNAGGRATETLRRVCKRCNNGWMSRLEQAAKPVITGLIATPCLPSREAAAVLARWATKTGIVMASAANHPLPANVGPALSQHPWTDRRAVVNVARVINGWDGFRAVMHCKDEHGSQHAIYVDFVLADVLFSVALADVDFPLSSWRQLLSGRMLTIWSEGANRLELPGPWELPTLSQDALFRTMALRRDVTRGHRDLDVHVDRFQQVPKLEAAVFGLSNTEVQAAWNDVVRSDLRAVVAEVGLSPATATYVDVLRRYARVMLDAVKHDLDVLLAIDRELPTHLTTLLPGDYLLLRRHWVSDLIPDALTHRTPAPMESAETRQLEMMGLAMARQWMTAVPHFIPAPMSARVLRESGSVDVSGLRLPATRVVIFHDAVLLADLLGSDVYARIVLKRHLEASGAAPLVFGWMLFADDEHRVLPVAQLLRANAGDVVATEASMSASLVSSSGGYLADVVHRLAAVVAGGEWRRPVPMPPVTGSAGSETWKSSLAGPLRRAVLDGAIPGVWVLQDSGPRSA